MFRMHREAPPQTQEDQEMTVLPEGFDQFPEMIKLREDLIARADDPIELNKKFDDHIAMLHRTLPDEFIFGVSMYYILRGDYEEALQHTERFDFTEEDYSICEFLKNLQKND